MQKEEYEEWMSIDEDIPEDTTLTDLEICQDVCKQYQAIKVRIQTATNVLKKTLQRTPTGGKP
ncbi:hypothetical protein AVEN_56614-1, partial [Araneus ventricosus]